MRRQRNLISGAPLARRMLVTCLLTLMLPASPVQGASARDGAETTADDPALLLAWLGRVTDLALCGQTLRVALEIGEAPSSMSAVGCSPDAAHGSEDAIAGGGRMDWQVRAYTGLALRRDITRCQRELGVSLAADVLATDGVDRVLWSDQGQVLLARADAGRCQIVQTWRLPPEKPRVSQGMFVKSGAYVIVTDNLPGHDDTALLYYLSDEKAYRVIEHAWRLDSRPQLQDARTALVVGTTVRIVQNRQDPRLVQHPPPLLAIVQVDGPIVRKTSEDFLQHHDEQVQVRTSADMSRVAVARLGGLVSSVLVVGAHACSTRVEVVGFQDGRRIEGSVAPPRTWTFCSAQAFNLPHR